MLESISKNLNLMEVEDGHYRAVKNLVSKITLLLQQNF